MDPDPKRWTVGLMGYGEVGRILAEDLQAQGVSVVAYDLKFGTAHGAAMSRHAQEHRVHMARSHAGLAAESDLLISAVTASQAVPVVQACAIYLRTGAFSLM